MIINFATSLVTVLFASTAAWTAETGEALYKRRCAGFHGPSGEGKPAMKAPSLKETKLDANQITAHLMKGESTSKPHHNKGMAGLKEEDGKALAQYAKSLK